MKPVKALPAKPVDAPLLPHPRPVAALQALSRGEATPDQQRFALEWIMVEAASVGGIGFRGEAPLSMAFHEGRRFVGQQIMTLLRIDKNQLKDD